MRGRIGIYFKASLKNSRNIIVLTVATILFVLLLRFIIRRTMKLSELSLSYAVSQIGVAESPLGSNRGKEVETYLKSVGLGGGYPWCMAFVYWAVSQAAKEQGKKNPLYKTGGVLLQLQKSAALANKTPEVGSIFIMDYGNGTGHTGIVESIEGNYVHTIEGNTNGSGSRVGGIVMRQKRPISKIRSFIHVG